MTNKEQDNDSDYLIMRKANYSPRSLEDYLSQRIAVKTKMDQTGKKRKIDFLSLSA